MTTEIPDPLAVLEEAYLGGWNAFSNAGGCEFTNEENARSFFRIVFFSGAYALLCAQRELHEVARGNRPEGARRLHEMHSALDAVMGPESETEH